MGAPVKAYGIRSFFTGQGGLAIGSEISESAYATATAKDFTPNMLGDIATGSYSYTGEDVTLTPWVNAQGQTVTSVPSGGSYGYTFSAMITNKEMRILLLGTKDLPSVTFPAADWIAAGAVTPDGVATPVSFTRPFFYFNADMNKTILFPKASWSCALNMDADNHVIKCVIIADKIDTANLQTVMFLDGVVQAPA